MTPTPNPADGIVLLGVPALILVPLLVRALRRLGLPARWVPLVRLLAAASVAALAEAVAHWPALTPLVRIVLAALLLGLGVSGATTQARRVRRHIRARRRRRT